MVMKRVSVNISFHYRQAGSEIRATVQSHITYICNLCMHACW